MKDGQAEVGCKAGSLVQAAGGRDSLHHQHNGLREVVYTHEGRDVMAVSDLCNTWIYLFFFFCVGLLCLTPVLQDVLQGGRGTGEAAPRHPSPPSSNAKQVDDLNYFDTTVKRTSTQ